MAINSSGILSSLTGGLPTNRIVSQLVQLKRQPIEALSKKKASLSSDIRQINTVTSDLKNLGTALEGMESEKKLRALSTETTDEEIVTASADGTAAPSSYNIAVHQLARAEKNISNGFTDSAAEVKAGQLTATVNKGSTDEQVVVIDIEAGDTLRDIRDSIINDGEDSHLKIERKEKGHASDTTASNALTLDYSATGTTGEALSFTEQQSGQNTQFDLDGQTIERQTTTLSDVVEGVTFDLESTGSATVNVEMDNTKIKEKLQSFVDAFNKVVSKLEEDGSAGRAVKRRTLSSLRNVISSRIPGLSGEYTTLNSIGIGTDYETGQLTLDSEKADNAIQDSPSAVTDIFTTEETGIVDTFLNRIDRYADSGDGIFATTIESLESRQSLIDRDIENEERRVEAYRERTEAQFLRLKEIRRRSQSQFRSFLM